MSNILNALHSAYLDDMFENVSPVNYYDLEAAYKKLDKFEKKHNISVSEHNNLEFDVLSAISNISEQKGFVNGFRLAVQLISEAYGITKIAEGGTDKCVN